MEIDDLHLLGDIRDDAGVRFLGRQAVADIQDLYWQHESKVGRPDQCQRRAKYEGLVMLRFAF